LFSCKEKHCGSVLVLTKPQTEEEDFMRYFGRRHEGVAIWKQDIGVAAY